MCITVNDQIRYNRIRPQNTGPHGPYVCFLGVHMGGSHFMDHWRKPQKKSRTFFLICRVTVGERQWKPCAVWPDSTLSCRTQRLLCYSAAVSRISPPLPPPCLSLSPSPQTNNRSISICRRSARSGPSGFEERSDLKSTVLGSSTWSVKLLFPVDTVVSVQTKQDCSLCGQCLFALGWLSCPADFCQSKSYSTNPTVLFLFLATGGSWS